MLDSNSTHTHTHRRRNKSLHHNHHHHHHHHSTIILLHTHTRAHTRTGRCRRQRCPWSELVCGSSSSAGRRQMCQPLRPPLQLLLHYHSECGSHSTSLSPTRCPPPPLPPPPPCSATRTRHVRGALVITPRTAFTQPGPDVGPNNLTFHRPLPSAALRHYVAQNSPSPTQRGMCLPTVALRGVGDGGGCAIADATVATVALVVGSNLIYRILYVCLMYCVTKCAQTRHTHTNIYVV